MCAKEREEKVKTQRILEIDKLIRADTYPNATKLRKIFGVSRATINRDLDFLRDRYCAPIEFDYSKNGFYYTDKSFVIQNVMLSQSEIFSIFAIQPLLEQYRNTPLESSVKSIFQKLVDFMPGQSSEISLGGTLRLGSYPCKVAYNTTMHKLYGRDLINERHRHRYEFNNDYRDILTKAGLCISGTSPDNSLVETVEITDNKFFVGVQYHPEFKSRPNRPHPLFTGFIKAAIK